VRSATVTAMILIYIVYLATFKCIDALGLENFKPGEIIRDVAESASVAFAAACMF
jgi:hypothetical protein